MLADAHGAKKGSLIGHRWSAYVCFRGGVDTCCHGSQTAEQADCSWNLRFEQLLGATVDLQRESVQVGIKSTHMPRLHGRNSSVKEEGVKSIEIP